MIKPLRVIQECYVVSWRPTGYPHVEQLVGVALSKARADLIIENDIKRMVRFPPREVDNYVIRTTDLC